MFFFCGTQIYSDAFQSLKDTLLFDCFVKVDCLRDEDALAGYEKASSLCLVFSGLNGGYSQLLIRAE